MPHTHPDMLETITAAGRRLGLELSPVEVASVGAIYMTQRPSKTGWQTVKLLTASIACPEAGPGDNELRAFAKIVEALDAGYWCATLEHD
jgi:hypothetical protein